MTKIGLGRGLIVVLLLVMAAAILPAREPGDLMLTIEPQIGIQRLNTRVLFSGVDVYNLSPDWNGGTGGAGADFGLRGVVHYYFFPMLGVHAGLGISGFGSIVPVSMTADGVRVELNHNFYGVYATIPVGVRTGVSTFTAGAGLTLNFPISSGASFSGSARPTSGIGQTVTIPSADDSTFKAKTYLGYYLDLGFDLSRRPGRTGGFGMLGRFSGALGNQVATSNWKPTTGYLGGNEISYAPFSFWAFSLVFQATMQLANIPMGR
ncbi:MAG: hypothetical protein FWH12_09895 [Treponema sp.]|nr:hypothetical protein [Treponema sp.]